MICIDVSKCTGCRRCEITCAFFHTGQVARNLSRIKVMHLYETGIDGPVACCQCRERFCMQCPVDALALGSGGQILCDQRMCILCGACETLCPIGAVEVGDETVYVCDLCDGRPRCVEACTEGAITFNPNGEHPSLRPRYDTEKRTPSEKRHSYIADRGARIRKKWREPCD